jgi:acetyl esterase/lipase
MPGHAVLPLAALSLLAVCPLAPAGLRAALARAPAGLEHIPDLEYSRPGGRGRLALDLVCPARGKGPFPAVLVLHGGAWVKGSRKACLPMAFRLAREGYVAAVVSHRFAPANPFPAQVHDVKCAVRWLRACACAHSIDPDRIGVLGYSSGGHLACLLGTTPGNAALEGATGHTRHSSGVQVVVSCYGVTDLAALHASYQDRRRSWLERKSGTFVLGALLGGPPGKSAGRYAQASPLHHAGARRPPPCSSTAPPTRSSRPTSRSAWPTGCTPPAWRCASSCWRRPATASAAAPAARPAGTPTTPPWPSSTGTSGGRAAPPEHPAANERERGPP